MAEEHRRQIRVKAVLVDPGSMKVLWMNGPAREALPDSIKEAPDISVEQVVPLAEPLGVRDALAAVARSGDQLILGQDVVSTARGSIGISVSLNRLPDGNILVLAENAWEMGRDSADNGLRRRFPRRGR